MNDKTRYHIEEILAIVSWWRGRGTRRKDIEYHAKQILKVIKPIDYRKEAKGRPCMIRLTSHEVHNHDPATVTLHHCWSKRLFGVGMGQKPPDIFGAWVCAKCHDIIHRPVEHGQDQEIVLIEEYEAIFRTQNVLHKEGKL